MKKSFVIYMKSEKLVNKLTDEQAGKLFKSIFRYMANGELPEMDLATEMAFTAIQDYLDENNKKYESRVNANRENGKKGGRPKTKTVKGESENNPKNPNGFSGNPKNLDSVSDSVSVSDSDTVSPNGEIDISVSTDVDTSSAKKASRTPYSEIVDVFNSYCPSLPKVERISKQRKQKIKTLYNEYGLQKIFDVFEAAERSDFLSGRSGAWRCNFDWLLNPTNFLKVLEGNYENKAEPITNNPFLQMLLDGEYDDDSGGDDND